MNTYQLIQSEALLVISMMAVFGIYFLVILERLRRDGTFYGIKGIVVSLLCSTFMITGSILLFQHASYPEDLDPTPNLILDYSVWPAFFVWIFMHVLILLVAASVMLSGERNDSCHHKTNCEISKDNMKIE